jgi:hypothetical protein
MLPAPSLSEIRKALGEKPVSLIGIIFAPPYTKIAAERIVPRLGYLNARTAAFLHFFCAGYGGYRFADDAEAIDELHYDDGTVIPWGFSQTRFAEFVTEMEESTSWKYSGEVDIILIEPRFSFSTREPELDFSEAIVYDIESMVKDGAIDHPSRLFEAIISFARSRGFATTATGLSNKEGTRVLGQTAAEAIIELMPVSAQRLWKRGVHYRVQDISR